MNHRAYRIALFSVLFLAVTSVATGGEPVCFDCHTASTFKGHMTHSPVATGQCTQCHSPHLARYKGLLVKKGRALCFQCHQSLEKNLAGYLFQHQPVAAGQCSSCHDPHSAERRHLLKRPNAALCADCHAAVMEQPGTAHAPFAKGQCNECHSAHGSNTASLLKSATSALCLNCHAQSASLRQKHLNRDLSKTDCLECHQPHQSTQPGLLREKLHRPFADRACQQCHATANTMATCLGCHDTILSSFNGQFSHIVNGSEAISCFNCHSPHASRHDALIKQAPGEACRQCHSGKFERRSRSLYLHPNATHCTDCHQLHSSARPGMRKADNDDACVSCHEKHNNFSHPMADKAIDPRNDQPMGCISCHDPCTGTMFKYNLRGTSDKGLCIQCHTGY